MHVEWHTVGKTARDIAEEFFFPKEVTAAYCATCGSPLVGKTENEVLLNASSHAIRRPNFDCYDESGCVQVEIFASNGSTVVSARDPFLDNITIGHMNAWRKRMADMAWRSDTNPHPTPDGVTSSNDPEQGQYNFERVYTLYYYYLQLRKWFNSDEGQEFITTLGYAAGRFLGALLQAMQNKHSQDNGPTHSPWREASTQLPVIASPTPNVICLGPAGNTQHNL